jgi:outer membrane receptor protein involved in Fe transport
MLSGIGEAQYSIRENINLLAGVRIDKHVYTGVMVSPRASIVWQSKNNHLMRFQYSKSNRRQDDADLRYEYLSTGEDDGQVETINFYELSGDIHAHKKLVFRPSVYYSDFDVIAWSGNITKSIGNITYYGAELSAIYKGSKGYGQISHNFIRINKFSAVEEEKNNVSVSAYGYGHSFHNFPDHLTKLFYQYKVNKKMSVNTSLQITWRLQGAEDNANYNRDSLGSHIAWDLSDKATSSHKPSAYLNAGYVYKFNTRMKASFFAYNLLGLIDENLNKRVEFQKTSHYRIQPTAFALRFDFDF